MTMRRSTTRRAGRRLLAARMGEEHGAVAVLVAVIAVVLILFLSFVIDLGNAFQHHRHLQLQADAAALAGAGAFSSSCSDSAVIGRALEYSAVPPANTNQSGVTPSVDPGSPYNWLYKGAAASRLYEAFNSRTYLPTGNTAPADPTTFSGSPCSDSMLDVKVTETKLPWYFQAGSLNYLNAHARAVWSTIGGGFMPLAVDETAPLAAEAYFVNESTGAVLATAALTNSHNRVGSGTYASDDIWTSTTPTTLPITSPNIGVIIALSGDPSTTACGQPLVTCYNRVPGSAGEDLVHIQGYSNVPSGAGSTSAPIYRSVTLSNPAVGGCSSAGGTGVDAAYYSVSTGTGSCTINISADVAMGNSPPANTKVKASLNSKGNQAVVLTNTNGLWTGALTVSSSNGANPIYLEVCTGGTSTCTTPAQVQASFTANDNPPNGSTTTSGPIDEASVQQYSSGTVTPGANSFPACDQYTSGTACNPQLMLTVDVGGSLHDAASTNDPLFSLNFGSSNTSSQTGTIVCPPGNNSGNILGNTVLTGCPGTYQINYSAATSTFSDPLCANVNPGPGGTPPPPADCVQAKNGGANGAIASNLYDRFVNAQAGGKWYCKNNWSNFNPNNPPHYGIPQDDDRIVSLFITPYGAYSGSGTTGSIVPIVDLAYFYVEGWNVPGQNSDPCTSDPAGPSGGSNGNSARLWGHFIAYSKPGTVTQQPCRASSLGGCTIALTQ